MDFFCKIERVETKPEEILQEKEKIFYVDKYKPILKDDFIIHNKLINIIDNIVDNGMMNLYLYGKKDTGKYTLARYFIQKYYNHPCNLKQCIFNNDGKDLMYFKSNYHFELYVDDHNCNIINLVKSFLQHIIVPINSNTFDNFKNIILIKNFDLLKPEVVNLIKYFLDKHYNNIFILIGKNPNKIIKSFFYNMRVPSPTEDEINKFLKKIIKKEGLKVKKKELSYIIDKGSNGLFSTISLLELCYIDGEFEEVFNYNEKLVYYIYKLIKKPSIEGMIKIREYLNTLLINNVNIKLILEWLLERIQKEKKITQQDKMKCVDYIVDCEFNFKKGYREIHHLEYCIIRIINLLKNKWE